MNKSVKQGPRAVHSWVGTNKIPVFHKCHAYTFQGKMVNSQQQLLHLGEYWSLLIMYIQEGLPTFLKWMITGWSIASGFVIDDLLIFSDHLTVLLLKRADKVQRMK